MLDTYHIPLTVDNVLRSYTEIQPAHKYIIDIDFTSKGFIEESINNVPRALTTLLAYNAKLYNYITDVTISMTRDFLPDYFKSAPKEINIDVRILTDKGNNLLDLLRTHETFNISPIQMNNYILPFLELHYAINTNVTDININVHDALILVNCVSTKDVYTNKKTVKVNYNLENCISYIYPTVLHNPTDYLGSKSNSDLRKYDADALTEELSTLIQQHIKYPYSFDLSITTINPQQTYLITTEGYYVYGNSIQLNMPKLSKGNSLEQQVLQAYERLLTELSDPAPNLSQISYEFIDKADAPAATTSTTADIDITLNMYIDAMNKKAMRMLRSVFNVIKTTYYLFTYLDEAIALSISALYYFEKRNQSLSNISLLRMMILMCLANNWSIINSNKRNELNIGYKLSNINFHLKNISDESSPKEFYDCVNLLRNLKYFSSVGFSLTLDNSQCLFTPQKNLLSMTVFKSIRFINNSYIVTSHIIQEEESPFEPIVILTTLSRCLHIKSLQFVNYTPINITCDNTSTLLIWDNKTDSVFFKTDLESNKYYLSHVKIDDIEKAISFESVDIIHTKDWIPFPPHLTEELFIKPLSLQSQSTCTTSQQIKGFCEES